MTKDTNSRFEAVPPLSELSDGDAAAACDAVPEYCDDFFDDAPASEPEHEHEESLAVKSADSDGFVVEKAELTVPTLLEASAGTGKTFSIKHLVLRLIVEQEIPINSLLVVTFTKAATAELKSRIREHLCRRGRRSPRREAGGDLARHGHQRRGCRQAPARIARAL